MIRNLYSTFFILIVFTLFSQEGLKPLGSNFSYIYKDLAPQPTKQNVPVSYQKAAAVGDTLTLPFIEDFYYSTTSYYPDMKKWEDSTVYVNSGMGIAPPSIGVATFDGLNKHGYPYNPTLSNLVLSNPADTLTSKPINLHTVGQVTLDPTGAHVALSFFYQARGNGDPPELTDSLILDFYRPLSKRDIQGNDTVIPPDTAWKRVWFATGVTNSNTNDSAFKWAFVRVTDTAYFHSGFRFRFRNWASVTGNFDHWHVDYIFLDQNRIDSLADTVRKDITFGTVPTPFLRDYAEMPYQQYNNTEMAANLNVRIRNNGDDCNTNIKYEYRITTDTHASIIFQHDGGVDNLWPFRKNTCTSPPVYGYSKVPAHATPPVNYTFTLPPPFRFNYEIKHFIYRTGTGAVPDIINQNDTVLQYQFFRDFYGFDDGSAEAGYYVNAVGAKMALKINTNVLDTLKAFRIYFDPVGNVSAISNSATTSYSFVMLVWAADGPNGTPGTQLYKDSIRRVPSYLKDGFKEIPEFKLKHPLPLGPGSYFVGIQQASDYITIGFDRNYNHNTSLYFDAGAGWTQSTENGSLMFHPVFSNKIIETVGLNELSSPEKNKFSVYPNPSFDEFTILSPKIENTSYQLFNSIGQLIKEEKIEYTEQRVSTTTINPGIYILILKNQGQPVQQQKIIIQH